MLAPEPRSGHEAARLSQSSWWSRGGLAARCARAAAGKGRADRLDSRGNATATDPKLTALRQAMRELGYVEERSSGMEPRYAGGSNAQMSDQAAELERSGVDVIIAGPFEAL